MCKVPTGHFYGGLQKSWHLAKGLYCFRRLWKSLQTFGTWIGLFPTEKLSWIGVNHIMNLIRVYHLLCWIGVYHFLTRILTYLTSWFELAYINCWAELAYITSIFVSCQFPAYDSEKLSVYLCLCNGVHCLWNSGVWFLSTPSADHILSTFRVRMYLGQIIIKNLLQP